MFKIVKELVVIMPQMVFVPDSKGNYPMHIAIHNQQSHDIAHELFKAFLEISSTHDAKFNLLLFMLAARGHWKNHQDQLSTAHQLLREDPLSTFEILRSKV